MMTKEELLSINNDNIKITDGDVVEIEIKDGISIESLLDSLKTIFDYELETNVFVYLKLKSLKIEQKIEAIRYSLTREDLVDPYMLLNIINLIKIYNTLDDSFFNDDRIYVSSIEDLLDIKLDLKNELEELQKKISIYFLSLFKSYNKVSYEPLDRHIELKPLYKHIIMSLDLLTLSGIFSVTKPFSTEECVYIDNAIEYLSELLLKGSLSTYLMNNLLGECECQKNMEQT